VAERPALEWQKQVFAGKNKLCFKNFQALFLDLFPQYFTTLC